ncbi:MAG: transcriptional repressor [Candidatus Magasanikbacteria bacterium]|nr:transcriptional repressor [Candidatus Magasanikbacteria bacterium]
MKPDNITNFLKEAGYKSTNNRVALINYLNKNKGIFCANDLLQNDSDLDKVSLYRTIELFQKLDIIHPVMTLEGQQYYEVHEPDTHHHHAVCTQCHKNECIDCTYTDTSVPGFKEIHHSISITGICYKCSQPLN